MSRDKARSVHKPGHLYMSRHTRLYLQTIRKAKEIKVKQIHLRTDGFSHLPGASFLR